MISLLDGGFKLDHCTRKSEKNTHKRANVTQFNWISKIMLKSSSNKTQIGTFSGKFIMNFILGVNNVSKI